MRISDWSSDVCSSDLINAAGIADVPDRFEPAFRKRERNRACGALQALAIVDDFRGHGVFLDARAGFVEIGEIAMARVDVHPVRLGVLRHQRLLAVGKRSEEHTSELQSLMRISYAVFCLKKNKEKTIH